jgi:hypothetical protein
MSNSWYRLPLRPTLGPLLAALLSLFSAQAMADALMVNRSVSSSTIAQYFVEEEGVRVELDIGLNSLASFARLMPDAIYAKLRQDEVALKQRLRTFFEQDLMIAADGTALPGYVVELAPSKRVLRDPISGTVLPVQEGAPDIIRAVLHYPFPTGTKPTTLVFSAPPRAEVGFVVYHKGVAVNDFRYLASGYELTLDWEDPWYSSFNLFQLKRQYSAPMSGFIYVEHNEVRKEIIVRPKDLQRWVDLGLAGRSDIPPQMQPDIRRKVGEFLALHQVVKIDGQAVPGILQSVNFLARTLTSSRVIDPPELLSLDSAVMGAIFVYPRTDLPSQVTMDWDLWDDKVQRIPVSAVDEAGPLPSYLEPRWPQLEWNNHLTNPTVPALRILESPAPNWQIWLASSLPALLLLALACALWLYWKRNKGQAQMIPAILVLAFLVSSAGAMRYGANNNPNQERAEKIISSLLHNIYRSFDYREEGDVYDVLSGSVSGELLTDIFLETKRSLVLANQGGAEARVKNVALESVEIQPGSPQGSFRVKADWTVHGSVGHWGHIHKRSNRYLAELTVAVDGNQWKLQQMSVLQEERL